MQSFQELPLDNRIQKALRGLNFTKPTEIQSKVIPSAVSGTDVMACAETGSGKTAAYSIPMLSELLENTEKTALILAPTRELVQQIADFIRELIKYSDGLKVVSLVGGADIRKQLKALRNKPRIVVATPGRLTDHLKRKSLVLDNCGILVLDEGDRMLDMGFAPQLDVILKYLPEERQTSIFTATLPQKVQKLANKYLKNPKKVNAGRVSLPVSAIHQTAKLVNFKEKDEKIIDELNTREGSVIIFVRTKHRTNILHKNLKQYGFKVELIHGDRTQGQRNKAIQNFKNGRCRILCATDVAARGIDVPSVEHVINFDLPMMDDDYVHRIGRTARNGASGEALSFVTPEERRDWQALVRKFKIIGADLGAPPKKSSGSKDKKSTGSKKKTFGTGSRKKSSDKPRNKKSSFKASSAGGKKKTKKKSSFNMSSGGKKKTKGNNSKRKTTGSKKSRTNAGANKRKRRG